MNKLPSFLACKWAFARSLQIVLFGMSIGIGAAHFFGFEWLIKTFDSVTIDISIPIASEWIARASKTYRELSGLANVLQFAWLSAVIMICVNLWVALPELKKSPQTVKSLEDEREVIERTLFQRLYHSWFLPPGYKKNRSTPSKRPKQPAKEAREADRSLAAMIVANLYRPSALVNFILALLLIIYFLFSSEAGTLDINREFAFIGYPLLIFVASLFLTNLAIYIYAAIINWRE